MTASGKISGTLHGDDGTSNEVEIAGAKWSASHSQQGSKFSLRCAVGGESVLWSCTAMGRVTSWDANNGRHSLAWSDSFDYLNTQEGYACSEELQLPGNDAKFEAEIEVIKMRIVDLSSPTNEAIESSEDAACLEVEDQKFWVSKEVLSFHSPFFKALFSSDFKEKATGSYTLKDVKMADFKLLLSVIYNLDITINTKESLEGLLRLGDMYQADSVLSFCRDFLDSLRSTFLPLETEIELCDRHGFFPILTTIIKSANLEDLKRLFKEGHFARLSSYSLCLIGERLLRSM
uniref:BTB domain-containing protein n=1 Tax=Steinernema glaseri TaxID=37863 RepID=A0A1I8ARU0_9BILA